MNSNVVFDQNIVNGFAPVLTYAACEWFLIILMFIDALLSYLLVWFARYCRLQMPCFLCSKLLHPLHWRLLLCRNHRSEVSSFMSCHNHDNNLVDCRGMCDDCLLSFTKTTAPNPDMNRLLLGKLGYDLLSKSHCSHPRSCSCCNKPWRTRNQTQRLVRLGSRGKNSASKPNIPAPRHPLTRRGSGASLKKMMRDHKATSDAEYVDTGSRSDSMVHVGYKELKIHSDLESEFLFSDDDAFVQITDFEVEPSEKRVRKPRSLKRFKDKKMSSRKQFGLKVNQDKNIHVQDHETAESSMPERKVVDKTHQHPVETEKHEAVLSELKTMSEARTFSLGLPQEDDAGTSTHNENEAEVSGNPSPSGENSASRDIRFQEHDDSADFAQNISDSDVKIEASEADMEQALSDPTDVSGSVADKYSSDEENGVAGHFKPLASNNMPISMAEEQSSEVNETKVAEESFSNEEDGEVNGHSETSTSKNVSGSFTEEQSSEEDGSNGSLVAKAYSTNEEDADNGDSEHLTSNNGTGSATEEEQSEKEEHEDHEKPEPLNSPKISNEETTSEHSDKDSSEVKETQNTSNRSPELNHSASVESFVTGSATEEQSAKGDHEKLSEPLDSPNISNEESSLENSDKHSSEVKETQNTSNKSPELKHSASVESFVSINSDVESESHVDLLKKQLEHERKCLRELTKELEEERNASAIATDEAMGMIRRLQEEKAALHMEALQYLRMMDEQAEHDVDALEKANDILADREKEIQDLEMELEYYRVKYPDEPREEILASMGILDGTETSGFSTTDETGEKVPTDTELSGSSPAGV